MSKWFGFGAPPGGLKGDVIPFDFKAARERRERERLAARAAEQETQDELQSLRFEISASIADADWARAIFTIGKALHYSAHLDRVGDQNEADIAFKIAQNGVVELKKELPPSTKPLRAIYPEEVVDPIATFGEVRLHIQAALHQNAYDLALAWVLYAVQFYNRRTAGGRALDKSALNTLVRFFVNSTFGENHG